MSSGQIPDLQETPDSRQFAFNPPGFSYKYISTGEPDQGIVYNTVLNTAPETVNTPIGVLFIQDIQLQPVGYGMYIVVVPYGIGQHATGNYNVRFDTTGATVKMKAAKEHIADYPSNARNYGGTIGATQDLKIEGADIVIPALKLTVTYRHPPGMVTIPYAKLISGITGQTNADAGFLTFDAGELLFLGGNGECSLNAQGEVQYNYVAIQNTSDLTISGITNIVKQGHHYAWVEFTDAMDSNMKPILKPIAVHVERVYDAVSFSNTFGFS